MRSVRFHSSSQENIIDLASFSPTTARMRFDAPTLNEKIETIEQNVDDLADDMESLEADTTRVENEINSISSNVKSSITESNERISQVKKDIEDLNAKFDNIYKNVSVLENDMENNAEELNSDIKAVHGEVVSFHQVLLDSFVWPVALGLATFTGCLSLAFLFTESLAFIPLALLSLLLWIAVAKLITENELEDMSL